MQSSVNNRYNQKVEQLSAHTSFVGFGNGTITPAANLLLPLNITRQYEIHRIRIILCDFFNNTAPGSYAFPKFEQFVVNLKLNCFLGPTATALQKMLFSGLQVSIIDGITCDIVFKEPFVFQTSDSSYSNLIVAFEDDTSIPDNLTGYPPVFPNVITAEGLISFEGISYDPITSNQIVDAYKAGLKA